MTTNDGEGPPSGTEVPVVRGEWSGDVAGVACGIGVIAAGVSTWLFLRATSGFGIGQGVGVVDDADWVDGSFAQQATLLVVMFALWVASLTLIAASVLAVIETRAVLKKAASAQPPEEPDVTVTGAGAVPAVIEAAGVLADKLSRARGIVVLGVAGMVLAGFAMVTMMTAMSDGGGTVPDGAGQTATPTGDGTGETAPPAEDGGAQTGAPLAPTDDGTAPGDDEPSPTG